MNRNEQMAEHYKRGWTLERIGQKYGITRERVRQIVKKQGLTWKDGGQRVQMIKAQPAKDRVIQRHKDKARAAARKRVKKVYGCSLELWKELGGHEWRKMPCGGKNRKGYPIEKFIRVRRQNRVIGTEWALTLQQWWEIWTESDKWKQIGNKRGQYQMARIDKTKGFSVRNVKIVKTEDSKSVT